MFALEENEQSMHTFQLRSLLFCTVGRDADICIGQQIPLQV